MHPILMFTIGNNKCIECIGLDERTLAARAIDERREK